MLEKTDYVLRPNPLRVDLTLDLNFHADLTSRNFFFIRASRRISSQSLYSAIQVLTFFRTLIEVLSIFSN